MGFEHMTHLDPLEPYNHHMLYEIYTKLGAHKKALEEILYAHSLDPFDTKIFYSLILTFRRLGLYFEAMQLYMWNEPEEVQKEGS